MAGMKYCHSHRCEYHDHKDREERSLCREACREADIAEREASRKTAVVAEKAGKATRHERLYGYS